MTALTEYQRLESPAIWRADPADQRRDVYVSVGDATLVIYDNANRALAHWSLAAVRRMNAGQRPAVFSPGQDAPEQLEIAEPDMIDAIEKVRKTLERRRPRSGRLRLSLLGTGLAAVLGLAFLWLPDALNRHTAKVVPAAKRIELGQRLLARIHHVAGRPCETPTGRGALNRLYARLLPGAAGRLVVVPGGVADTAHLPGGLILVNRALVEDHEAPDVVAGYILAEALRRAEADPIVRLLDVAGPIAAFRLLTTGDLPDASLTLYAETLMSSETSPVADEDLLAEFRRARVAASPYAYARDISGETTLALIEADPVRADAAEPVLSDALWIGLQAICGE